MLLGVAEVPVVPVAEAQDEPAQDSGQDTSTVTRARGRNYEEAATTYIADCHVRAEDSCRTLAGQLAYAREFKDLLANRT